MTLDELVELTEAIVGDMDISDLRNGHVFVDPINMPAAKWGLLVRFLSGERPGRREVVDFSDGPVAGGGRSWDNRFTNPEHPDHVDPTMQPAPVFTDPATGRTWVAPPPEPKPVRRSSQRLELEGDFAGIVLP